MKELQTLHNHYNDVYCSENEYMLFDNWQKKVYSYFGSNPSTDIGCKVYEETGEDMGCYYWNL